MSKFLNTSAANYYLEELIKNAQERLILISPYLRINDKIRELIEDKNRLKIDIRIIYGKSELQPDEIAWLKDLDYVRISFCKNLHAKCYLNENSCIITSLNLYEFSQVNNNEMGVYINKEDDIELYKDTFEEAQRLIRVSDEVRLTVEKIDTQITTQETSTDTPINSNKLSTSKLAVKLNIKTKELNELLVAQEFLEIKGKYHYLTEKGKNAGGQFLKGPNGFFFIWPEDLDIK